MRVAYYATATGRIRSVMSFEPGTPSTEYDDYVLAGESTYVDDTNTIETELHYIVGGVKTDRPVLNNGVDTEMLDADGTSQVTFTIPASTIVVLDYDGTTTTAGGSPEPFTLKSVIAGEWNFHIMPPFPARELLLKVIANAV